MFHNSKIIHWGSHHSSVPVQEEWVILENPGRAVIHILALRGLENYRIVVCLQCKASIKESSVCPCVTDVLEWESTEACGSWLTFITQCLSCTELTVNKKGTIPPMYTSCVFFCFTLYAITKYFCSTKIILLYFTRILWCKVKFWYLREARLKLVTKTSSSPVFSHFYFSFVFHPQEWTRLC